MELNIPQKYRTDIEKATNLLKNEGCKAIYLFGAMVTG
jgi:thiamine pyrophosphokinase